MIDRIPPISFDLRSDVFVLINRKLEEEFKSVQVQFPVAVYYVDDHMMDFQKSNQKRERAFPSGRFITDSAYVIEVVRPLDFLLKITSN